MILRRKLKMKSGINRGPKREWPKHEQFVRRHDCVCSGSGDCEGRIECAHVRLGGKAGTGIKPPSWQCIPLCSLHHGAQHRMGHRSFDALFKIDSLALAAEFARQSTNTAMKKTMKDLGL